MGRRRCEPKEMEALVARRDALGLTWSDLSVESGIPRSTLQLWGRKLRIRGRRGKRSGFVRVAVVDQPGRGSPERVEVVLRNGRRLVVPHGFDAEDLARLAAVLERGC